MTFSTTGLDVINDSCVASVFRYIGPDTIDTVKGAGFFAGVGAGSRGANPRGMRVGDLVFCVESTDGTVPGRTYMGTVSASTADQTSTSASTGWKAAYNCTVQVSTSST